MRRTIRKLALPLTANMLNMSGWTTKLTRRPGTHLLYLHHVSNIQFCGRAAAHALRQQRQRPDLSHGRQP